MAENCTIYCTAPGLSVRECVSTLFPSKMLVDEGESLIIEGKEASLRISNMRFEQPGDRFSRLIRTTYCHFELVATKAPSAKASLLAHIQNTQWILGVVADPAFDADERFNQAVFVIAKAANGIVFNGCEMLDQDGVMLLDNDGSSEFKV